MVKSGYPMEQPLTFKDGVKKDNKRADKPLNHNQPQQELSKPKKNVSLVLTRGKWQGKVNYLIGNSRHIWDKECFVPLLKDAFYSILGILT